MSKINPGSNVHGDNDLQTAHAGGMEDIDFPEPKVADTGKLQCPVCNRIFNSREDYISHALAQHQTAKSESQPIATAPLTKSNSSKYRQKRRSASLFAR